MNTPPTQIENASLTKPADWSNWMVNAAVKYALAEAPTTCSTPDKAKLEILNSLNWLEAHDEYEWPDFQLHGLDFAQAMKLRRALVNDVFIGMNKGGHLRITPTSGGPAAPSSGQGPPSGERLRLKHNKRKVHCKRQFKREDDSDAEERLDNDKFLAKAMRDLLQRSDIGLHKEKYMSNGGSWTPDVLANMVHDCLVDKWSSPVSAGLLPPHVNDKLKQKQEAWARALLILDPTFVSQCDEHRSERLERSSFSR